MFDELETVKKYFRLAELINQLIIYKKQVNNIFYSQNMATRIEYTSLGVQARAFKIEKMVIEHQIALELINKRIERFKIRKRYFDRFLSNLSENDYNELMRAFKVNETYLSDKLKDTILDEIDEIEIMLCLRDGIEVPEKIERVELSEDFNSNLTVLSSLFAI